MITLISKMITAKKTIQKIIQDNTKIIYKNSNKNYPQEKYKMLINDFPKRSYVPFSRVSASKETEDEMSDINNYKDKIKDFCCGAMCGARLDGLEATIKEKFVRYSSHGNYCQDCYTHPKHHNILKIAYGHI